jgi:hypothetical protein
MTGSEHYQEAEKHAEAALEWLGGDQGDGLTHDHKIAMVNIDLAMGQLHATLALAALVKEGIEE